MKMTACKWIRGALCIVLFLLVHNVHAVVEMLHDATHLGLELDSISKLIQQLQDRKRVIQRALDIENDNLRPFDSAFVPLVTLDNVQNDDLVDVFRLLRKDRQGQVFFAVIAKAKLGQISIHEADGGDALVTFSIHEQQELSTNEEVEMCEKEEDDRSPIIDIRVGSGGSRPFVTTLQASGRVRIHGLSIRRGNVFDKTSFWRETNDHSNKTETVVTVRPNVYVHLTNATVTVMQVYSTTVKSLVLMATKEGEVHIVDTAAVVLAKPKTTSFQIIKAPPPTDGSVAGGISHLALTNTQVAIAFDDGIVRFATIGTNKVAANSRCVLPLGLGHITSLAWIESKLHVDKNRFLLISTSQNDLLLFDRKSADVPSLPAKASSSRGNLLANLFGAPTGKTCTAVRRLPGLAVKSMLPLPYNQILAMTKRGPEILDTSTLFATHGGKHDVVGRTAMMRRTDFVHGGSLADFAIILKSGTTANAYAFLGHSPALEHSALSDDSLPSSSVFAGLATRGPFVFVLALAGLFITWKRRFSGVSKNDAINRRVRFGGAGQARVNPNANRFARAAGGGGVADFDNASSQVMWDSAEG